jgi:hypothetical protein
MARIRKAAVVIAQQHHNKNHCSVCGARTKGEPTCDKLCARAHSNGVDRGTQVELEARRDARRPYPESIYPAASNLGSFLLHQEVARLMGYPVAETYS